MRYFPKFTLLFIFQLAFVGRCHAQNATFDALMKLGKAQFDKKLDSPDYSVAVNYLKKATLIKPNNSEAHYFLGYAYSRLNSHDGSTIPKMNTSLVLLASKELETVNALSPLYKGAVVVLDPYSKITSEWGALALSFIARKNIDSAKWAFNEGKKRGGFDELILAINRATLNSCSKNAILISCGDNYTFPLFYLQLTEKLRPDVVFMDVDMLSTKWYPSLLEKTTRVKFGLKEPLLDTLEYEQWKDSTIAIPIFKTKKVFKWTVKPTYDEQYVLRGDRILLSLLKENQFKSDIYFTKNFATEEQLGLNEYLLSLPAVNKLNAIAEQPEPMEKYIKEMRDFILSIKYVNPNSTEELAPIDGIRTDIIDKITEAKERNLTESRHQLLELLKTYLPIKKFPCYSQDAITFLENNGLN